MCLYICPFVCTYATEDLLFFQLKNMIGTLSHSNTGGSNAFEKDGTKFGWSSTEKMLQRERGMMNCLVLQVWKKI